MEDTPRSETLQAKLLKSISVFAAIGLMAILIILPYSFYRHDRKIIQFEVRERADMIRTGILSTMMATAEPAQVLVAIESFKKIGEYKLRIIESDFVRAQFGGHDFEQPADRIERGILDGQMAEFEALEGTTFRYVSPFVSDHRCQKCHKMADGTPVAVGTVLGLSEFVFDVADRRSESLKMIMQVLVEILLLLAIVAYTIYRVFNTHVLAPINMITDSIARLERDEFRLDLPAPGTKEIDILTNQVRHTATVLEEKKRLREEELEAEREKVKQIHTFAAKQADLLGITDQGEISEIISRLQGAVKEVEKSEMLTRVCEFVTLEKKEIVLGNDVSLIRAAALYLTDLIAGKDTAVKKGSIELALEEAITNGIVHGNLEVSSKLKEEDYTKFDKVVNQRAKSAPFNSRRVKITYDYGAGEAFFKITDEGPGFDWKSFVHKDVGADFLPHGRGIVIMRTFAKEIGYNDKGNEVFMRFNV